MLSWWAWFIWCEFIGEALYELLAVLHRSDPDAALVIERAFDAEFYRLNGYDID